MHLNLGWEIAQLAGLAAVIGCVVLCVLSVRPRLLAATPLSLRKHEIFAWLTLAAALVHVLLLPLSDRRVVEHLKLTTPWYEWAGMLALVILLLLTLPSVDGIRRRLWSRHRNFQALHVGIACILIPVLAAHVLATNRYVHGRGRVLIYLAASAVALLALLRVPPRPETPHPPLRFINRLVFGRHSPLVLSIVAISACGLAALALGNAARVLREAPVARTDPLPIDFPHDKHRLVACVKCHHNFTDRSGDGGCIGCHRSGREQIRLGAEARFHDFCLGCHRDPPPDFEHHGPVTGCSTCHVPRRAE